MPKVNEKGYIVRRTVGGYRGNWRNWWLVKYQGNSNNKSGRVKLGYVTIPPHLIGRKIKFKIEVIDDDKDTK